MADKQNETQNNKGTILNVCLNYGAQEEIIRASERYHEDLVNNKVSKNEINRDNFYKYLDINYNIFFLCVFV